MPRPLNPSSTTRSYELKAAETVITFGAGELPVQIGGDLIVKGQITVLNDPDYVPEQEDIAELRAQVMDLKDIITDIKSENIQLNAKLLLGQRVPGIFKFA